MNYKGNLEEKRRLKNLYDETKHSHRAGAYYNENKNRIMKFSYAGTAYAKYLKRCSSKSVRRNRYNTPISKGNRYKRYYDYWWMLF